MDWTRLFASDPPPRIESPCRKVCELEGHVCVGCGRTLDEITRWTRMSDRERRAVMERLGHGVSAGPESPTRAEPPGAP